jgi:hypothetical protein
MITICIEEDDSVFEVPIKDKGSIRLNVFELFAVAEERGWFAVDEKGKPREPSPAEVGPGVRDVAWSPSNDSLENFTDRELYAVALGVFKRANDLGKPSGPPPGLPPGTALGPSAFGGGAAPSPTPR